jgi:hypothetical protein
MPSLSEALATLRALRDSKRDREATPRRFKTCTLKVFDYDEDGGLTSRSAHKLAEIILVCPLAVTGSVNNNNSNNSNNSSNNNNKNNDNADNNNTTTTNNNNNSNNSNHASLFEQITAVLPFEDWARLYYYEQGQALNRELVYERITHNDQDLAEHMKTQLEAYARRINSSPARMCFQLHRRFPP